MIQRMALLKYLKLKKFPLPDPEEPLSAHVSTKCIEGANEKVSPAGHMLAQGAPVYMKSWRLAIYPRPRNFSSEISFIL